MEAITHRIVSLFPSQARLASELGISQPSVAGWVRRGNIPSRWHIPILEAAKRLQLDLAPEDFFRPPVGSSDQTT